MSSKGSSQPSDKGSDGGSSQGSKTSDSSSSKPSDGKQQPLASQHLASKDGKVTDKLNAEVSTFVDLQTGKPVLHIVAEPAMHAPDDKCPSVPNKKVEAGKSQPLGPAIDAHVTCEVDRKEMATAVSQLTASGSKVRLDQPATRHGLMRVLHAIRRFACSCHLNPAPQPR